MKVAGVLLLLVALGVLASASASASGTAVAPPTGYGARKSWTLWSAVVVGKVLCDQCLESKVFPFARPMNNAKVSVQCKSESGEVSSAQASTNFLGDFVVGFKGRDDLAGCSVSLAGSADSKCNVVGGGGKTVSLKSKFLFKAVYVVDPLFYKPATPLGFCPKHAPRPKLTVPFPNRKPSTCSCWDWLRPDFKCYWPSDLSPHNTTVGAVFGRAAQKKYGASMTLAAGLLPGDELRRQAIAALLNARTNRHFFLSPRAVTSKLNKALSGSGAAQSAQRKAFQDANSGYGKGKCLLVSCPW